MEHRIIHIDNAKAIGIMLIAVSHLWVLNYLWFGYCVNKCQ